MGLFDLFEAIFCGRITAERDRLRREVERVSRERDGAIEDKKEYIQILIEKTDDYEEERNRRRTAESERSSCLRRHESCLNKVARAKAEIEKLEADVDWYEERRKTLEKALQDATVIPDIPLDEETLIIYEFDDPLAAQLYKNYDVRIADKQYYLLPYETWIEILTPIQAEVKESLKRWRTNITDCDDWAYVMGAITTQYFAKTGVTLQGAFMIVWDMTGENRHAYNAFIDTDRNAWIYEPQNGTIIGKLGETPDPYESTWLWFPG